PIHPLGSPSPPPAIQDKPPCAISESRPPLEKSERHPGNAGLGLCGAGASATGGAIMPLMPAFRRRRKASAIVGRLLAGYGEVEFLLAFCCAGPALASRRRPVPGHTRAIHRSRYENIAIKRIFRIRGGTGRINAAKKLTYKSFLETGMKAEYDHTMGA